MDVEISPSRGSRAVPGRPSRTHCRRLAALLVAAPLLLTGCSGGPGAAAPAAASAPIPMTVEVSPAADEAQVEPDSPITVTSADGRLDHVDVTDPDGRYLEGAFSDDHTTWTSTGRLAPDTEYRVDIDATSMSGERLVRISRFSTVELTEDTALNAIPAAPADGAVVGVAYPLVVEFDNPVKDRAAVAEALEVDTSSRVEGGWYWIDAQTVHYRPENFWPAGTVVTLHANLAGLDVGGGMWGASDRTSSFTVGREQIIKVDVDKHRLRVIRDGETLRSFGVSTGKPGWETRNGVKVVMEKVLGKRWTNEAIDAPEEYTLFSDYAMRMTNSGEFLHDAPWNVGNIGENNTSHGCVGMTVADMRWLYGATMIGDPVVVAGSPRQFTELWNRYQDWNVEWDRWQSGNADLSDG